jgi:hypothetical protein
MPAELTAKGWIKAGPASMRLAPLTTLIEDPIAEQGGPADNAWNMIISAEFFTLFQLGDRVLTPSILRRTRRRICGAIRISGRQTAMIQRYREQATSAQDRRLIWRNRPTL